MNLTYNEAYRQLFHLVNEMEDDTIMLDALAEKVKQAKELIDFCEKRLRVIEEEVGAVMGENEEGVKD